MTPPEISISTHRGADILPFLNDAARLRISVFRSWPYLYEGTMEHEAEYLRTYAAAPDAVLVVARTPSRIVGVSTAIPLIREPDSVQAPFRNAGIPPESVFYFGESILEPAWRGHGIGVRFFTERERCARSTPGIQLAAFCAVDRLPSDPRRPHDYQPLDSFWQNRGFSKTHLQTHFTWLEIGSPAPTSQSLTFWTKPLTSP